MIAETQSVKNRIPFVLLHWGLSRLLIWTAIVLVAPLLPAPDGGSAPVNWQGLMRWDSQFYLDIATQGYHFVDDGQGYNVAFFPLLPLLMRVGMMVGLPAAPTGILANNLGLLGAMGLLYGWVQDRHGRSAARWATIALAWCPFSLFATVLYTEGLFLLFSTAALSAFDYKRHRWAALWGALASATRLPGLMLMPAFLWVSWRERRGIGAIVWSLAVGAGTLSYSLFCWLKFGEPLAFLKVQKAWHPDNLAFGQGWLKSLVQITLGAGTWRAGRIVDLVYPIAIVGLGAIALLLWHFRQRAGATRTVYGFCLLGLGWWALAGSPLVNMVMVLGSAFLLCHLRRELRPVALSYGLLSIALILSTGRTASAERYMYSVVPVAIAFGIWLSHHPRWRYPVTGFFALLLVTLALRFSQQLWAG